MTDQKNSLVGRMKMKSVSDQREALRRSAEILGGKGTSTVERTHLLAVPPELDAKDAIIAELVAVVKLTHSYVLRSMRPGAHEDSAKIDAALARAEGGENG